MNKLLVLLVLVVASLAASAAVAETGPVDFNVTSTLAASTGLVPRAACGSADLGNFGETNVYAGTGTHLGALTLTENLCLFMSTFDPPARPFVSFTSFGTYEAANGDTLSYLAFGAYNVATGTTSASFTFLFGSGRFTHAEGAGVTAFTLDENGSIMGVSQSGLINYDASDRSD